MVLGLSKHVTEINMWIHVVPIPYRNNQEVSETHRPSYSWYQISTITAPARPKPTAQHLHQLSHQQIRFESPNLQASLPSLCISRLPSGSMPRLLGCSNLASCPGPSRQPLVTGEPEQRDVCRMTVQSRRISAGCLSEFKNFLENHFNQLRDA